MNKYGISDKGLARAQNQDSFIIREGKGALLAIVCDGIGGHRAGDVASRLACQGMVLHFDKYFANNPEEWFCQSLKAVNRFIYEKAIENSELKGMGTTMVAALIMDGETWIMNVGDSRCYEYTEKKGLVQLTEDHSLVNELIKNEGMDPQKAYEIGKHVITRAVGIWLGVEPDIFRIDNDYQWLLLCSDGLYNYVPLGDIADTLANGEEMADKAQRLVDFANVAGGYDNITAVMVEM
ncbi:MAG: Stp1/IreP family PP2C-type Ser/Thr phosphatase [Erysipelotrichaceae bacterium]|nr:Stp1/IreP family PP2C-type Ser/Thr phosphatase [Erysipelotrichaceae bacterium]